MSTRTEFIEGKTGHEVIEGRVGVAQEVIDFSLTNVSASDVVPVIKIPAGVMVTMVRTRLITAEGATCTAKIGNVADDDAFKGSVNLNAAAGLVSKTLAADAGSVGVYYADAGTIDLTMANGAATAKLLIEAEYHKVMNLG